MSDQNAHLDLEPRLRSLPGPARLVRITAQSWDWLRRELGPEAGTAAADQTASRTDTETGPGTAGTTGAGSPAPALDDLVAAGILDGDAIDGQWAISLEKALRTPVRIVLVSIDGDAAWTTTLFVAGRRLVVLDQVREVSSSDDTVRLGRASSAVILAVTDIQFFSATIEALIPQRPAFLTPGTEAADVDPVDPDALVDAPAVAEIQTVITSAPLPGAVPIRDRSWYALGEEGEVLGTLTGSGDDVTLSPAPQGSLSAVLKADLVTAIRQAEKALAVEERAA